MSQRWMELLRHRRREYRQTDRVLNIGHRGARALAPENTLAAIEAAAAAGADMIEIDVHRSLDGALVVTHDLPERLTLAALRARQPQLPVLAECLERARALALLVNVEIKNVPRDPAIEDAVVGTVTELQATHRVVISSFDHESIATVRRLNHSVATAVLTSDRLHDPVSYLAALDADAFHPRVSVVDRAGTATVRASGRGVNVWTVNDRATMQRLIASGVSGIVTDYPDRLRALLDTIG